MDFKLPGVIAIIVFLFLFVTPLVLMALGGQLKNLSTAYLIILLVIQFSFIVSLFYGFIKGKNCLKENKCDPIENLDEGIYNESVRVYKLFTEGGIENFQYWYASLASNVWFDLLFTMVIFFIPFPFLPEKKFSKVELFFVKLGMYKLSLAFILGSPRYIISDYKIRTMSTYDKGLFGSVIGLSSIAFLLVLFEIIKKKK
tara:strand:+ start:287 stop:886 length:600 start_codon:yes stop_codon:yes gene_type:complete